MAKTTHWCMGHAMDSAIGFGEKHLDCGMELPADQENEATPEDPSSCCENKTQHLQVDDDFQVSQLDFQLNPSFTLPFIQVFGFGLDFLWPGGHQQPGLGAAPPAVARAGVCVATPVRFGAGTHSGQRLGCSGRSRYHALGDIEPATLVCHVG